MVKTEIGRKPASLGALTGLSLSMLLAQLGTSIANVGLPTFIHVFSASFQEVQWILLSYLLATTTLVVTVGRLGDLLGRRKVLVAGVLLFTAASLACGLSPSLGFLVAARAAQGLGAAVMMVFAIAMVSGSVPQEKTGSAMGLLGTMSSIGTSLGPSLGGVLIAWLGWQALFYVQVPLGLLTLFFVYRYLPADGARAKVRIDVLGTVLLALSLAFYALAMTLERDDFGLMNIGLLLAAGAGVVSFVVYEKRATSPLIDLEMFRRRTLSAALIMSLFVMTVMMTTLVVGPFYLSLALGLNPALVGLVMSVGPFVAALTAFPAGRLVDRLGSQPMTVSALVGVTAGCVLLAVPLGWGVWGYVVPLALVTSSYSLFQTANNTAVMTDVSAEQRGGVSGLLTLSRNLGLVTGAAAMGAVFASVAGVPLAAGPEVDSAARITFAAAACLVAAGLVIALGLGTGRSTQNR